MTTPDRAHLRKLADAASQPPWRALGQYVSADGGRDGIAAFATDADAEFIAATRSAVPALLDALEQAEAKLAEMSLDGDLDIVNGWLVMRGVYPGDYVEGYGIVPDSDAEPIVDLKEVRGWPGDALERAEQAEARIKAVRELHHHDVFRGHLDNGCAICGHDWPCPTIRAMDDTHYPETEGQT